MATLDRVEFSLHDADGTFVQFVHASPSSTNPREYVFDDSFVMRDGWSLRRGPVSFELAGRPPTPGEDTLCILDFASYASPVG